MFSLKPELEQLRTAGQIRAAAADALIAREEREVVSVYGELRFLSWGGVMLIAAGVGIIVSKNLDRIGPIVIAVAIAIAAAACYAFAAWKRSREASLVDDYVLLLGSLLLSSDIGWIEHNFHLLGGNWQRHLLLLALIHAVVAYLFESRTVLSLSLAALAGWMGLERNVGTIFDSSAETAARALGCAAVVIAWRVADWKLRPRGTFGPVFDHFAANLAFWGALALAFEHDTTWVGALLAVVFAVVSARHGLTTRSEAFVAYAWLYGIVAVDVAVSNVVNEEVLVTLFVIGSTIAAIVGLFVIHARMRAAR